MRLMGFWIIWRVNGSPLGIPLLAVMINKSNHTENRISPNSHQTVVITGVASLWEALLCFSVSGKETICGRGRENKNSDAREAAEQ